MGAIALTGGIGLILGECFNRAEGLIEPGSRSSQYCRHEGLGAELRKQSKMHELLILKALKLTLDRAEPAAARVITQLAALAEDVQRKNAAQLKKVAWECPTDSTYSPFITNVLYLLVHSLALL